MADYKKTKRKKKTTKAQNGYPSPWDVPTSPYQYPQGYYPEVNYFGEQPRPLSDQYPIAPQGEMQVQPLQQSQQLQQSQSPASKVGGMAAGLGRGIGQAVSAFAIGAPQLINALLPEDNRYREDTTLQRAYNRYPQGTGSQAIYENGGEIARNGYRKRKRKQGNIQITEEIPTEDNLAPIQPMSYVDRALSFRPSTVPMPPAPQPRDISFRRQVDVHGQPTAYLPQFQGYSYNEANQALPQLPESFGGIPVVRSPQNYLDFNQGFLPGSQSDQWTPYDTGDYTPLPLIPFEYGGEIEANSGIKINPKNKGKFTKSAKSAGMGVQEFASHVLANKEDYSTTQVRRANFARNAKKFKHEFGGYLSGQELDLSTDEIQNLIDQGYEIEIL